MNYLRFQVLSSGCLRIELTQEGREELKELASDPITGDCTEYNIDKLIGICEWERPRPEELGSCCDSTYICLNPVRNSWEVLLSYENVWWHHRYETENILKTLEAHDFIDLAPFLTAQEGVQP